MRWTSNECPVRAAIVGLALVLAASLGCEPTSATTAADTGTPTPRTRAAQTAAAIGTPTLIPRFPTGVVYLDSANGQPVWPTPPAGCSVSAGGNQRSDLGVTIGESPIWMAASALPIIPWRNEFVRSMWVIDRSAEGELIVSGKRTDGDGTVRFIRPGAGRASEQLRVPSAARIGAAGESPTAAQYADIPVFLELSSPGCWEFKARIGSIERAFTVYVYN